MPTMSFNLALAQTKTKALQPVKIKVKSPHSRYAHYISYQ